MAVEKIHPDPLVAGRGLGVRGSRWPPPPLSSVSGGINLREMHVCSHVLRGPCVAGRPSHEDPRKKCLRSLSSRNNFISPEPLVSSYFKDTVNWQVIKLHTCEVLTHEVPFVSVLRMAPFRVLASVVFFFSDFQSLFPCYTLCVPESHLYAFWPKVGYNKSLPLTP